MGKQTQINDMEQDGNKELSTLVTEEDLERSRTDSVGVIYSYDGKRLLGTENIYLHDYVVRDGVKVICDMAFEGSDRLESITIPNSVKLIGTGAFHGCTRLENITLPDSMTNIGEYAFWGCSSLNTFVIPASVKSIGSGAFNECNIDLTVQGDNFIADNGCLIDATKYIMLSYFKNQQGICVVSSIVKEIGREAFCGCDSLNEIKIHDNVVRIGERAFID